MQAILILTKLTGFIGICNALRKFGLPKILTVQLLMIFRYISVLLEEASNMRYSMISRGYGEKSFSIKLWTRLIGALFLKSYERSKRIHYAMLSRGFNGFIPLGEKFELSFSDSLFCILWISVFLCLYFFDISKIFFSTL